jgi:carbon-monoxide dehydrogenase small subunit
MRHDLSLTVNGRHTTVNVESRLLLVHLLRDQLGLTGTHVGCDSSNCGACTVLLDGEAVKSCTVLAASVDGSSVVTVEGLAGGPDLTPVQEGFRQCHGLQCGYCTPGMVIAATSLLLDDPQPTDERIRHALEGNLCRCTGYQMIVESVRWAAGNGGAGEVATRERAAAGETGADRGATR